MVFKLLTLEAYWGCWLAAIIEWLLIFYSLHCTVWPLISNLIEDILIIKVEICMKFNLTILLGIIFQICFSTLKNEEYWRANEKVISLFFIHFLWAIFLCEKLLFSERRHVRGKAVEVCHFTCNTRDSSSWQRQCIFVKYLSVNSVGEGCQW